MYPLKTDPKKQAKVCARHQRISKKNTTEIGRFIKGMKVESAKTYLEQVLKKKKAIPYTKYNTNLGHKKGMGPGRYPLLATQKMLELLNSAQKNAEYIGLDTKILIITNVWAAKGSSYQRPRRTRFSGQEIKSTNISLIVEEGKPHD
ncbi:MAG: 50S ribosomal protein L22 [Candidatus Aenigmarchaeota archaeon]|nr:50S ribosomal protein L22 [Candidatus Aenigmarchaeota archaeon]